MIWVCGLLLLALSIAGDSRSLTLLWDANPPEQNVEFYTVYSSPQPGGPYHAELDVPSTSPTTATIQIVVAPGECVYFVATASRGDRESAFSNEAAHCEPIPIPEPDPPVVTPPKKKKEGGCFINSL